MYAVAVNQIHTAVAGRLGLLAHILYAEAEVAAALVDIEITHFEHCTARTARRIEIREGDVVAEELIEPAVEVQEFIDLGNRVGLFFQGLVGFDQLEQRLLVVFLEDGIHGLEAERFDLSAGLGAAPGGVGTEFGQHGIPLRLVDSLGIGIIDIEGQGADCRDGSLPGRVDRIVGEHAVCVGAGQRIGGDLLPFRCQVIAADGGDLVG